MQKKEGQTYQRLDDTRLQYPNTQHGASKWAPNVDKCLPQYTPQYRRAGKWKKEEDQEIQGKGSKRCPVRKSDPEKFKMHGHGPKTPRRSPEK